MRHFVFGGDPKRNGEGPRALTAYGLEFDRTTPTLVEDEVVAKKLSGNSHFIEVAPASPTDGPEDPPPPSARRKGAAAE